MQITVPAEEATAFADFIATDEYRREERDYKWALHLAVRALLTPPVSDSTDLVELLSELFSQALPDLSRMGVSQADRAFISAHPTLSALANLSGGKWGAAQFTWIPRAIEYGLGPKVGEAFKELVDADVELSSRVDVFRDRLYEVSAELQAKGGFEPSWTLRRVALPFVAAMLAAFDPGRYTFYSAGALQHGYGRYAGASVWPTGTAGKKYAAVCEFVQGIADALAAGGVPVADLIDAQSFVWLSFGQSTQPTPKPSNAQAAAQPTIAAPDLDTIAADLAEEVYWPLSRAQQLVGLVHRWGQVLFQGPPGTGKTFVAERLARLLSQDQEGRLEVVQFHPSYAYEDFVEGIRPVVTEGSQLSYEVRRGVFLKLAQLARENADDDFFLVIDELNRANLARVLGELLYALEYRGPEHTFRLPYSGDESYVPRNITFIATMNTADRSIALVDAAIRRRFRHVNFSPDTAVLKAWLADHGQGNFAETAAARLNALNQQLLELLDADRLIGHTYLMRDDLADAGLQAVWEEDVEPVLSEHLYNQRDEMAALRETFLAVP